MSKNREPKMSFSEAMDLAESMDLPDGAFWAMSHELAGLEYGDGFDELAATPEPAKPRTVPCAWCKRKFPDKWAVRQHTKAKHQGPKTQAGPG